ncbi:histidine kinase [Metabacillus sp. GX 13764]|uniref:sensor histidine kinase n=1 Tax=Metabacillus kandeliae TaxID=2900151 RepID=UPI001E30A65E|nr:histidine kinase [Metabacillus kandeliae]MCD7034195.1 histidine kinase [Metabacillus kandeliae]
MKYNQIKWLILIIPTLTIALWEYTRHAFLLPYISMEAGNILSPILVFVITLIFVRHLFHLLEKIQEELRTEKAKKMVLVEREKLARELHDGIAQSLFLLSVKMNKLGRKHDLDHDPEFQKALQTMQHVHSDTRQAISNLKYESNEELFSWTDSIQHNITELENTHSVSIDLDWHIHENSLSPKEKVELMACIKEAFINVIKHAGTDHVWIEGKETKKGWICLIKDQGIGINQQTIEESRGFGLRIIQDRAREMGWSFSIGRIHEETIMEIKKEMA